MLRSLFTGISGLKQHQTMMDVTANNIANVNSAGFKSSSTVFEDTLSQMMRAAGAPQDGTGGTNPAQVGLGVRLGGISTNFSQGSTQSTGRATDLTIQGDGFFAVKQGTETMYTRDGSFNFDQQGRLVTNTGALVQGWTGKDGKIDPNSAIGGIQLPLGALVPPSATEAAGWKGNLPAGAASTPITGSKTFFDPQGNAKEATYTLTKAAAGGPTDKWDIVFKIDGQPAVATPATLEFNPGSGMLAMPNGDNSVKVTAPWGLVTLDVSKMTEYGGENSFQTDTPATGAGSAAGSLQSFTISPDGTLIGVFTNGLKQPIAQIATANFNNPGGLEKVGGTMFRNSVNSGSPEMGVPGNGGRGSLLANSLEMSNVDLASEFTNLIVAQRGFQANSKIITASDELLGDLVNLKR